MDVESARRLIAEHTDLNAFISLSEERGDGPVVAVKDMIDVAGMVTTGGGTILPPIPATADAACIRLARAHGCAVVGKTNLHEWAFGPTSANPHFGPVRNPRDRTRIPGGSSGGSAAAVAAGLCDWAVGTDTGGSIRMPASLCGVVGIKPTLGTVSTQGIIPLAPSLDTVGPLAPDVASAARALGMLCNRADLLPSEAPALARLSIGVPAGWVEGLDEETERVWRLVSDGLPEVRFPDRQTLTDAALRITGHEAAAFHQRWMQDHPDRYGEDVLSRLRDGAAVTEEEHDRAMWEREMARSAIRIAMRRWDAVILPATACVAPRHDDPDRREPLTRFLRPFSLTGQPVVSIPGPADGLPVGIQVVGRYGDDAGAIRVALALEKEWSHARD